MGAVQPKNNLYLAVSKGKMVNKKKGLSYGGYTGYILGIDIVDDEYEGKPVKKVDVKMKDDKTDEIVIIQFTLNAWYSIGFFSRIFKVDVKKPFTIGVTGSDDNEKVSFCYMKQDGLSYVNKDGKKVEAVEGHKTFAKPEEVDLGGGQKTKNWAKPIAMMEKVLGEMKSKIEKDGMRLAPPPAVTTGPESAPVTTAPVEDDLPF